MSKFKVTLLTTTEMLPTLLGTVAPEIQLLSVEPYTGEHKTRAAYHYGSGKRNKGITGEQLMLQLCATPATYETIRDRFTDRGFAKNSFTPVLSRLKAEKKIKENADGKYVVTK